MSISNNIEQIIKETVSKTLEKKNIPENPSDYYFTDNIAETIEKLCILHIRTWFLEDMAGVCKTDSELADIKRKVDICFKQKRPALIQAINRMVDAAILDGKSLKEDSVKIYKGFVNDSATN